MHDMMWMWWWLTVGLCAWKIGEGLWNPRKMLEWPFLACTMWAYFYGYMAYKAQTTLSEFLGNGMSDLGQLMALLCLIGLLGGWYAAMWVPMQRKMATGNYPLMPMWAIGFILILIGAAGNYSVTHAISEGDMNFKTSSAYWYLLYQVGYPGMAIAAWAVMKMRGPKWIILGLITLAAIAIFMLPQVQAARRGPLFPAALILLLVPYLTIRRPPNRVVFLGSLIVLGAVMLIFVQVRDSIYTGGTWGDAFQKLDVDSAVVERGQDADDNEYVNSCQVIATLYQNGKYEYGTGHLELLVHWFPHALWPGKPTIGEGIYSFQDMFDDVEANTGVRLLGFGASAAGVADSFTQYGIFCPIYWFFLAFGIGLAYAKVLNTGSPWWIFSYTGLCCTTHWLISQSFAAAFVPGMYFQIVPLGVLVLVVLYRRYQRSRSGRRLGPRRPVPSPAPASALPSS